MFSSSGIAPPDAESANTRQRNRRPNAAPSAGGTTNNVSSTSGLSAGLQASDRLRPESAFTSFGTGVRSFNTSSSGRKSPANSWMPNWSSIQEFASTLLANPNEQGYSSGPEGRSHGSGARPGTRKAGARKQQSVWGPAPPSEPPSSSRPRIQDVAAGPVAAREAELKARKTASILESHPGVNGGLNVRGKYKHRTSDENLRSSAAEAAAQEVEDCLVYIHHVQPTDTYFGIILKYRCREDVFRRSNGLWSRDNIQVKKWVVLPVDVCEIKGRPCDDPSLPSQSVDLLAPTPTPKYPDQESSLDSTPGLDGGNYFSLPVSGFNMDSNRKGAGTPNKALSNAGEEPPELPWTHVRWVLLESSPKPVEIARMSRATLGYFPPRRKKSLLSTKSGLSTPRQSLDVASDRPGADSPRFASRRQSALGLRPAALGTSPMSSSPSRYPSSGSGAVDDQRPAWMRLPGGVGSMSKSVHAPGPARDSLNKWTTKHLPGLNIETLPSMSVMGAETAHFGFNSNGDEAPGLVENSVEDGRDVSSTIGNDTGLDKAAVAVETWLRGAFAKRPNTPNAAGNNAPSTSFANRIGRQLEESLGDLIELEDGPHDDGLLGSGGRASAASNSALAAAPTITSGWRTDGDGIRGRNTASFNTGLSPSKTTKGKKSD